MWLFTETGFVSAVKHHSDPDTMVVRARDQGSLEPLAHSSAVDIQASPNNDYPYRVHVSLSAFSSWLHDCVQSIDYTNFKSRVHEIRGDHFADVLMGVWSVMHEVEDDDARTI